MSVQRLTPNPDWQPVGKNFYRQKAGELHAETAQSALTVIFQIGHWWSNQHHLDCFRYSQSSVPGQFVSISLRPVFRIVATVVVIT